MMNLYFMSLLILLIASVVMIIASILSKKMFYDREKISPFECGFDPMGSSRIPFSIRFFLITIIFLIFDVEIALILPMVLTFKFCSLMAWILTSMIFIIILLLGLYHEWNQGALNWTH